MKWLLVLWLLSLCKPIKAEPNMAYFDIKINLTSFSIYKEYILEVTLKSIYSDDEEKVWINVKNGCSMASDSTQLNTLYPKNAINYLCAPDGKYELSHIKSSNEFNNGNIKFTKSDNGLQLILDNLRLPPNEYQETVKVNDRVLSVKKFGLRARSNDALIIELPDLFSTIKDKIFTDENGFISIIIILITILGGVLQDKIKGAVNATLDTLGKYIGGGLAQRRFLKRYLDNIIFAHMYLKLIGFNTAGISRPLLEQVFVSLRVSSYDKQGFTTDINDSQIETNITVSFSTALKSYPKMAILGSPGAGKTTVLSYTLLMFAQRRAQQRLEIEWDLLPIFIPLRRLLATNKSLLDDIVDPNAQIIPHDILNECPKDFFKNKLKTGACILLLDGLDEVTDEKTHHQTAEKINNLAANYPNNHYIVTCRIAGWKNLLPSFNVLETQDFSRTEIQRFIYGWHRAIITKSEENKLKLQYPDDKSFQTHWQSHLDKVVAPAIDLQSKKLISAIDENSRILAIAVNPMLLSLISLVHLNRSILPKGRTLLYAQCIEFLIDAWDRSRDITSTLEITSQQKENVLREIAFNFQIQGIGEQHRDKLEQLIASILPNFGIAKSAENFLLDIEQRSGLLIERSIDVLGFSHLTLQEYLSAKYIHLTHQHVQYLYENFDTQEWREVVLLYVGMLDDASDIIRRILQVNSIPRLILAGYCIGDAMRVDPVVSQAVVDELWEGLFDKQEHTEERLNALVAIAADYEGEAVTVEQKLAQKIVISVPSVNPILASYAIEIAGKARLTCALPRLIALLRDPQDYALIEVVDKALIAYGNLALPALNKLIEGLQHVNDTLIYRTISILTGINTTIATKILIKLYQYLDYNLGISYAISQLLNNSFIESDLLSLRIEELPANLKKVALDNDAWPYSNIGIAFRILDQKIRTDLSVIIASKHDFNFNGVAFKQLLPVIVSKIKQDIITASFLVKVGFDTAEGKLDKIQYFATQIKNNPAQTLEYAFIQSRNDQIDDETTKDGWRRKTGLWICNFCFFMYLVWFIAWIYVFIDDVALGSIGIPIDWQSFSVYQYKFTLLFMFVGILIYISIYILSYTKKQSKLSVGSIFGWLLLPLSNIIRVLPYLTKFNIWTKWGLLMVLLSLFSISGGLFFDMFFYNVDANEDIIYMGAITSMILIVSSASYLKFYVLKNNPINQLCRLHKKGKELI